MVRVVRWMAPNRGRRIQELKQRHHHRRGMGQTQPRRLSAGAIRLLSTWSSRGPISRALWASTVLSSHGEHRRALDATTSLASLFPSSSSVLLRLADLKQALGRPLTADDVSALAQSDLDGIHVSRMLSTVFLKAGPSSLISLHQGIVSTSARPLSPRESEAMDAVLLLAKECAGKAEADAVASVACSHRTTTVIGIEWARQEDRRDVLRSMHAEMMGERGEPRLTPSARLQGLLRLAHALSSVGDITLAHSAVSTVAEIRRNRHVMRLLESLERDLEYLRSTRSPTQRTPPNIITASRRGGPIPYLLHNSLPFATGGYATRTHGLLTSLRKHGWEMRGFTRAGFPLGGLEERGRSRSSVSVGDVVDGVPYLRSVRSRDTSLTGSTKTEGLVHRLLKDDAAHQWQGVHAASNYVYGLAAAAAGRILGIPSIYEVRGFWEITRASLSPGYDQTERYRLFVQKEVEACHSVDRVLAITGAVKDLLIERGINADKITVVPNGVDSSRFIPLQPEAGLKARLGLEGRVVLGYIGSIREYEGLPLLLEALRLVRDQGLPVSLLVVGDGDGMRELAEAAASLGFGDKDVVFTGRVAHEAVESYYSIVDIAPFPRLPLPVTEIISPMKPFEAMALGKAVIVSSVAALSEIVDDGVTGLIAVKGDASSLAQAVTRLVEDHSLRESLGSNAREWVVAHRDWSVIAGTVGEVYSSLGMEPSAWTRS